MSALFRVIDSGSRVAHLQLLRPVGDPARRSVFLARDTVSGGLQAVRFFSLAGDARTRKAIWEARALAALRHPGLATVTEVLEEDGLVCLVMDYVTGASLRAHLDACGALPLDQALEIGVQLADALGAAHAVGLVHGRLAPRKVLLNQRFGTLVPRVLGVGHEILMVDPGGAEPGRRGVAGTPGYAAPERIHGSAAATARSDVFTFGVLLYEMLTGQCPFHGRTVREVLEHTLTGEVVPVQSLRPECPAFVAEVVERCLKRDPMARFADAGEACEALDRVTGRSDQTLADAALYAGLDSAQSTWLPEQGERPEARPGAAPPAAPPAMAPEDAPMPNLAFAR